MSDLEMTRSELYEKVWERPMTKVAPELGLSDVGLAKICRKFVIPRPPVGYWVKLAHGKTVERAALPELDDESLGEIIRFREQFETIEPVSEDKKRISVEVSERLSKPHILVQQAMANFKVASEGRHGILNPPKHCLEIHVSKKTVPRALRIFDALIKAWENEGGTVSLEPTAFELGANSVRVTLTESVKRYLKEKQSSSYWKDYGHELTGKLTLEIQNYGEGLRRSWKDGKVQTLESVLGRFIESLHVWMKHLDAERLDNECKQRQEHKASLKRVSAKRKAEEEKERRAQLMEFVTDWEKANRIRRYLDAIDSGLENKTLVPSNSEKFDSWLEWARWYASYLCPLSATEVRESSIERPELTQLRELDLTRETRNVVDLLPYENTNELFEMDREELRPLCKTSPYFVWKEILLVLEGLGYDINGKEGGYWH